MSKQITVLSRGRLGNQMFIYAFARSLSLDRNCDVRISCLPLLQLGLTNRLNCFRLSEEIDFVSTHTYTITQKIGLKFYNQFSDYHDPVKLYKFEMKWQWLLQILGLFLVKDGYLKYNYKYSCSDIIVDGYLQSLNYFSKHQDIIRKDFEFKEVLVNSCQPWSDMINQSVSPSCVHVRLGDYVNHPVHGVANADYYNKAIELLRHTKPECTLFVFSDNIDLVKQSLASYDRMHFIPSELSDQQTMYLGTLCENYIISNSSFSWWMQFLSKRKDKIVYAPSKWYANDTPCDIYQKEWKIIEV